MNERASAVRRAAEAAGQGHVFRFWDRLGAEQRAILLDEMEAVDLDLVGRLAREVREPEPTVSDARLEPPELFPLQRDAAERARAAEAEDRGAALLAEGGVGYLLVAGGQASRLGFDGPKGDFPVGPVTGRTLFDVHARRLRAATRRFGARTPWYVMTSPANDAATRRSFEENGYYGLDPEDVFFFVQEMLPALDLDGRILLAGPHRLFLAPNGHGGVLQALVRSGALADMRERGIRTLSYFQVDNPLARPADPVFLGLHRAAGAGMSSKVVAKTDPTEKVGVLGRIDGRMGCIEYSDLPDDLRHARDPDGQLAFRAGNIAVHLLDVDFVDEIAGEGLTLPWHVAKKKMQVVDERGRAVEREGVKFETFVFDALSRSESSVTMEVERAREFSPVKNATGTDSPETCRRDLCRLFAGWIEAAGRELPPPGPDGLAAVEVDPLLAESEEEFVASRPPEPEVTEAGHHYAPRDASAGGP